MPRQQRDRSNTGYYHIMIRGNERKDIFIDEQDKMHTWPVPIKRQIIDVVLLIK